MWKVSSHGIHMCNMKAQSLLVWKLWPRLKFLFSSLVPWCPWMSNVCTLYFEYTMTMLKLLCILHFRIDWTMEFGFQPRVNEFEDKAKALLKQITERWVSMVKRDEAIYQSLMTVSTQFTKHEIFYMKYIQPVFLILSLACLVIVSVVFKRGNALKSVQILLLFSCTLEVCVILIIVPLDTILATFADSDVPVPHPLCSIYLYVSLNVLDGILITALAIKIIFSINR